MRGVGRMSKAAKRQPELIILAVDAQSIYRRFQGWPELLAEGHPKVSLEVPIFEELPLKKWRARLMQLAAKNTSDLRDAMQQLKRVFGQQQPLTKWESISHSLMLHFLLFGVGSQWLFNRYQTETGAVVVNDLDRGPAIWPGFRRSNQEYGISCLLGTGFERGTDMRDLLSSPEVAKTLATLDEEGMLIVTNAAANRVLNRLGGLEGRRPDGSFAVRWPTLEAAQLDSPGIREALRLSAAGLILMLQQTVLPLVEEARGNPSLQGFLPGDLAVAALAVLADVLAADWRSAGLLPETVQALLEGLV